MKAALAGGEHGLVEMVMATHAGMTTEEFDTIVTDWIATAKHPKTGRLYTEMVYQPMLELLAYLRANGFKTFIVSGGGIEFMRPWAERVYGIPPEQVVGSSIKTKFELRDGKPVLVRLPELNFIDDKAGKPVGIQKHIGRRPIAAFGNSDGDLQMLQWTAAGSGRRFCLYVHHTDAEREWAYDRESHIGRLDKGLDEARREGLDGRGHEERLEADLPVQPIELPMTKATRLLTAAFGAALWLASATPARAQTEDILPPPLPGLEPVVPELVEDVEVKSHWFTLHLGLVPIFDYTWFTQDQASVDQVGVQENDFDIRSARIMARGTIFAHSKHAPRYLVAFEYRGFDSDPNQTWNFTDVALTFPLGRIGDLTVGKTKESFAYEMVGDAANLPHVERLMSPFFVSRNIGLRWNRTAAAERVTLALGVYNDWFTTDPTWEESGTTVTGRVTGLAWTSPSGRRFLHLAGAFRRNGADAGTLRFKGRPESNVTDNYVDTGSIPASHANQYGLEALWNEGPVSLTAEYDESHVDSQETGDPQFRGWYVTAAWVVTAEHRPYDKKVGYARRVMPTGRWGAWELIARYGLVDLTDQEIDGGYLKKWFAGVNWWANRRVRVTAGYGRATLDKLGTTGHTNQYFTRVQWVY